MTSCGQKMWSASWFFVSYVLPKQVHHGQQKLLNIKECQSNSWWCLSKAEKIFCGLESLHHILRLENGQIANLCIVGAKRKKRVWDCWKQVGTSICICCWIKMLTFSCSLANGHIMLNTPVLVRSLKLSNIETSQYLDGWPPGKFFPL